MEMPNVVGGLSAVGGGEVDKRQKVSGSEVLRKTELLLRSYLS